VVDIEVSNKSGYSSDIICRTQMGTEDTDGDADKSLKCVWYVVLVAYIPV
jgi:hypothetical protein